MNKKIAIEFAVGAVILLAAVFGAIFWFIGVKDVKNLDSDIESQQVPLDKGEENTNLSSGDSQQKNEADVAAKNDDCKTHYYDGEAEVTGWFVSTDGDALIVAVKNDEISKLPTENSHLVVDGENFNFKLVDPTDQVRKKIKSSSEKKPTKFIVRGYAEICQQHPLISLKPATVVYKK